MKMSECDRCPLHKTRKKVAIPRGDGVVGIMLVGEAPGHDEDISGKPFVGKAGKVLSVQIEREFSGRKKDDLLGSLTENNFWITNIVKCRPLDEEGKNRPPTGEEITACSHWLDREIARKRPWLIVALGKTAAQRFFPSMDWSKKFGDYVGKLYWSAQYECAVLMTYHPSFVARGAEEGMTAYLKHFNWIADRSVVSNWWWQLMVRQLRDKMVIPIDSETAGDDPW
jgi:DNA polymerase